MTVGIKRTENRTVFLLSLSLYLTNECFLVAIHNKIAVVEIISILKTVDALSFLENKGRSFYALYDNICVGN